MFGELTSKQQLDPEQFCILIVATPAEGCSAADIIELAQPQAQTSQDKTNKATSRRHTVCNPHLDTFYFKIAHFQPNFDKHLRCYPQTLEKICWG